MADGQSHTGRGGKTSTLEEDGCSSVGPMFPFTAHVVDLSKLDSGVNLSYQSDSLLSRSIAENEIERPPQQIPQQPNFQSLSYGSVEASIVDLDTAVEQFRDMQIEDASTTSADPLIASFPEHFRGLFAQDDDGDTKLHLAIIYPSIEATTALIIIAGAYSPSLLDIQNYEFRQTALHLAVITDKPEIVRLLVLCGATLDIRDRHGNTPLHLACSRGRVQCILEMTRCVADAERAWLSSYCEAAKLPPFEPRQSHLPDPCARDYEGRSCLHLLQTLQATERIVLIDHLVRNCSANINIQEGKSGYSLLHLAVKQCDVDLFSYLLQVPQLDVNLPTYSRHTALDIADKLNHTDMVHKLLAVGAKHSASYVPNESSSDSESDEQMEDDYDDVTIGGQPISLNGR